MEMAIIYAFIQLACSIISAITPNEHSNAVVNAGLKTVNVLGWNVGAAKNLQKGVTDKRIISTALVLPLMLCLVFGFVACNGKKIKVTPEECAQLVQEARALALIIAEIEDPSESEQERKLREQYAAVASTLAIMGCGQLEDDPEDEAEKVVEAEPAQPPN